MCPREHREFVAARGEGEIVECSPDKGIRFQSVGSRKVEKAEFLVRRPDDEDSAVGGNRETRTENLIVIQSDNPCWVAPPFGVEEPNTRRPGEEQGLAVRSERDAGKQTVSPRPVAGILALTLIENHFSVFSVPDE
jgi:hypothetical protein